MRDQPLQTVFQRRNSPMKTGLVQPGAGPTQAVQGSEGPFSDGLTPPPLPPVPFSTVPYGSVLPTNQDCQASAAVLTGAESGAGP